MKAIKIFFLILFKGKLYHGFMFNSFRFQTRKNIFSLISGVNS